MVIDFFPSICVVVVLNFIGSLVFRISFVLWKVFSSMFFIYISDDSMRVSTRNGSRNSLYDQTSDWSDEKTKNYKQMEKDLTCIYCGKVLSNFANLRRHLRIHEGIYPYQCKICHKKFSDASNYKKHGVVHYLANIKQ